MRIDVAQLPKHNFPAGTKLHRIHWASADCWYFSGDGSGRFDPKRTPGQGACYFAEEALGAWVESFRRRMALTPDEIGQKRLSAITLDAPLPVIDLTNRKALRGGVTAAVVHSNRYESAWRLSSEALGDGDGGVLWFSKHDLSSQLTTMAVFGPEGPADWRVLGLPAPATGPIPRSLISAAHDEFGYRVLPTP